MAIRSLLLARYIAIWWFLNAAFVGCGGQAGSESNTDTTPDVTPPTIFAKFPGDMQTSVPTNTVIAITFSEPLAINPSRMAVVDAEITVSQAISGTFQPVQKSSQWDPASRTLFVRPTTLLEADRHYTVRITNNFVDLAGNRLDVGNPDGALVWRFTTGNIFDSEKPVWAPNKVVQAVADRYDTITVCWWNVEDPQSQTVTGCPSAVDTFPPAAYDPPTNDSDDLIYIVQYKRAVDASFTSIPAQQTGAHRVTVSGLVASTAYEIQVRVSDLAANQSDEIVAANPSQLTTPPAGRLYAANQVANSLSAISDVGQAVGNTNAAVVTTDVTGLYAPTGIAVDKVGGFVYLADTTKNMISAYKLQPTVDSETVELGEYGVGHNVEPAWTIQGTLTSTDITGLCGPSALRFERHPNAIGTPDSVYLYVTNSLVLNTGYAPRRCVPDTILVFDVSGTPQSSNEPPYAVIKNADYFRTPLAFAVDEEHDLVYVANRDNTTPGDNAGGVVSVFSFTRDPDDHVLQLSQAPLRLFWGSSGGACTVTDAAIQDRLCGPTAAAYYNSVTDQLVVVNRGRNNLLVFSDPSSVTGPQTPVRVAGSATRLANPRPVGIFLDQEPGIDPPQGAAPPARVYVTTDSGQSMLIFDMGQLINANSVQGNVAPLRTIKGSRTMFGQPALTPVLPSRGPFAVAVVRNMDNTKDEAYVVTPGSFDIIGLAPVPNVAVFDVSVNLDTTSMPNTPPDRVLVNPLLGPAGMALDLSSIPPRLYVASFHANMILVYDNPEDFVTELKPPDRIIAGPATMLDHPVSLFFRRDSFEQRALYVVNQSSHSVVVFQEGDTDSTLLQGDETPIRYIGPPEGTDPFLSPNLTEMAYPTGLAIDPDNDILYVSNRDAEDFQDLEGRRIVAFQDASGSDSNFGEFNPTLGIREDINNVAPTWKIQGDDPPLRPCTANCQPVTDRTTLKRPAGLLLIRAADTPVGVDRLVVANREKSTVLIFRGVNQLVQTAPSDHNLAPTWTIANASFNAPFGLAFNAATKDLYVSDIAGRILAFNLSSLTVSTPVPSLPARVIQGSATGLLTPHGLALDPQN